MKALIMTILLTVSFASEASIYCHTPRLNKVFKIKDNKVTFFNEFDKDSKREIASVAARTQNVSGSYSSIVDFENHKHSIHIQNVKEFSDVNDYIIIKARSGHEVIYPLTCENR